MLERWLPVDGHPGYEVSDLGRVRSIDREIECYWSATGKTYIKNLRGQLLEPRLVNGYHCVSLGGSCRYASVHRLVAATFIGPAPDGHEVNHIDGVRTNNAVRNLEWVTRKENIQHAFQVLGRSASNIRSVIVGGVVHASIVAAAESLGCSPRAVWGAANRSGKCRGKEVVYG